MFWCWCGGQWDGVRLERSERDAGETTSEADVVQVAKAQAKKCALGVGRCGRPPMRNRGALWPFWLWDLWVVWDIAAGTVKQDNRGSQEPNHHDCTTGSESRDIQWGRAGRFSERGGWSGPPRSEGGEGGGWSGLPPPANHHSLNTLEKG